MSKLLKKSTYGAAILLAYTVLTFALAAHDAGVKQEVDEFTGEQSCSQIVINSVSDFTGISLLTGDFPEEIMILVVREIPRRGDAVFNMFGTLSGDKVYVRFPSLDEVEQFEPIHTTVEYLDSGRRYEGAISLSRSLMTKLLSSPTDVRVRFSSSSGSADFTINHDVIVALDAGFGAQCL